MIAQFATCSLEDLKFVNEQYLLPYLSYIRENRRVFSAVLSQPVAFDTEGIFHKLFDNVFRPILDRFDYPAQKEYRARGVFPLPGRALRYRFTM